MHKRLLVAIAFATVASPAAAQSYDFAELGLHIEAPEGYEVVQEGTVVIVSNDDGTQRIEVRPLAVRDRDASRAQRVERWFEMSGYAFDGAEEVRGDGSVVVTGEGGDMYSFVMLRDIYVDSDGGLRVIVTADPLEMDATLAIVDAIQITDPSPLLNAARVAGAID
jgi:hypothetical protein